MKDRTKEVGELLVKGIKKGIEETSKEFQKDEIKETINILYEFATNINSDYIYDAQGFDYPLISDCIEELLDYITNLQEENERLKDLCDKYEEEHNTAFKLWIQQMKEIPTYEEKKDLKYRINKAIEYINISLRDSYENDKYPLNREDFEHLLNILQGSDE